MKGFKKYLAVLCSAVLLVTMAACGSNVSTQPEGSSAPSSASVSEAVSQPEGIPSAEEDPLAPSSSAADTSQPDTSSAAEGSQSDASASESTAGTDSSESDAQIIAEPDAGGEILVAYFSATGNTEAVAQTIADTLGADLYEITPAEPYTDADLNWNDPDSRVNAEHEDPSARPAIAGDLPELSGYDTILIGYPLWWREAPPIVWNFVEQESGALAGKTVIPFCTSMPDGIGSSGDTLAGMAPEANWMAGERFGESLDAAAVAQWAESLGLAAE